MFSKSIGSLAELNEVSKRIMEEFKSDRIFAFYGELGAGKTTMIKAICKLLKVTDTVTSPTFSIINEYHTQEGEPIYHFDFYRIEKTEEVLDLGVEEYFDSGKYCFMEWPERIRDILPAGTRSIFLERQNEHRRNIVIT